MKKIFFTAVFLFSLLIPLAADEPLLDPADYTVYSKNGWALFRPTGTTICPARRLAARENDF